MNAKQGGPVGVVLPRVGVTYIARQVLEPRPPNPASEIPPAIGDEQGTREFADPEPPRPEPLAQAIFDNGSRQRLLRTRFTRDPAPGVDWRVLKRRCSRAARSFRRRGPAFGRDRRGIASRGSELLSKKRETRYRRQTTNCAHGCGRGGRWSAISIIGLQEGKRVLTMQGSPPRDARLPQRRSTRHEGLLKHTSRVVESRS